MREITSTCEKEFVQKLITGNKRLDGRNVEESRQIKINFGCDRGCVLVSLGNTCVLSQVSCELAEPRSARPSEGQLHVNVEISPMAAPNVDAYRSSEITSSGEYSRLLERCIRDSHCIDLESLCVVSGEKVWNVRVDVHVLNHDGNISECGSIAAVTSLAHFRRPDVTVLGADVTVHSLEERDPVPLSLLHMPFCMSLGVYNDGENLIMDPTELEEKVGMGTITIGLNTHQEVCVLHLGGKVAISKENILRATNMAFRRVQTVTENVKHALSEDALARSSGKKVGFSEILQSDKVIGTRYVPKTDASQLSENIEDIKLREESPPQLPEIFVPADGAAVIGEGGKSSWDILDMGEPDNAVKQRSVEREYQSSSSEEEETVTLSGEDKSKTEEKRPQRGWYSKNPLS